MLILAAINVVCAASIACVPGGPTKRMSAETMAEAADVVLVEVKKISRNAPLCTLEGTISKVERGSRHQAGEPYYDGFLCTSSNWTSPPWDSYYFSIVPEEGQTVRVHLHKEGVYEGRVTAVEEGGAAVN